METCEYCDGQMLPEDGLRLEGASGDRIISGIKATTSLEEAGACDLYVLATKAADVGTAAEEIGFYAASALRTEEQIFAEFREVEDVELVMELENKEEEEREKEVCASVPSLNLRRSISTGFCSCTLSDCATSPRYGVPPRCCNLAPSPR